MDSETIDQKAHDVTNTNIMIRATVIITDIMGETPLSLSLLWPFDAEPHTLRYLRSIDFWRKNL